MRKLALSSCRCLAMLLLVGSAAAGESWVDIGELHFPRKNVIGKLGVNLESMRRRSQQYEIWERITFSTADPGQAAAEEDMAERMTLWAIRCRRGALAQVTERVAGSFSPRSESLRFYVPSPASSAASVIETACTEARRRVAEKRSWQGHATAKDGTGPPASLERPPSIPDEGLDDDDE